MATTDYPVNHPLAVKHWASGLFVQMLKETYAFRFMGAGTNSLCQVRNEMKSEGDRVRVGLRMQLSGGGVSGDGTLEGNEESLTTYYDDIYIDQLRHAVRSGGKMSEQRVPFSVRAEARDGLADWWADRVDTSFFNQIASNTSQSDTRYTGMQAALTASATDGIVFIGTNATATVSLSTIDVFSLTHIDYAVEKAKSRTHPLRPLNVGGKKMYVMFIHNYQATDLRRNYSAGQWGDIQKAVLQGSGNDLTNPIFSGALGVYNNVILHETSRLPVADTNANARRAVLCGAQAAAVAFGKNSGPATKYNWVEELFDYENQLGVAAGMIWGLKKTQFNGLDFGTILVPTYAVAKA